MNHYNLNGNRYRIAYVDQIPDDELGLLCGLCDAPDVKDKTIYIRSDLPIPMLIDTLIHECSHGAFWFMSEETVEQFATDLSKVLIKELGIEKAPASSRED